MTNISPESSANIPSIAVSVIDDSKNLKRPDEFQNLGSQYFQEDYQTQVFPQAVDKQSSTPVKPSDTWWLKHLKEHPFKALSLAVSVYGGLILLAFFVRLGSMPELDLAGAMATLAAVAVIGLLVVFAMGGTTIAAGLATRSLALDVPHLADKWSLVSLAAPGGIFIALMAVRAICDATNFKIFWLWGALALSFIVPACGCYWHFFRQNKNLDRVEKKSKEEFSATPPSGNGSATKQHEDIGVLWDYILYSISGFAWFISALMAYVIYETLARQGSSSNWEAGFGLVVWGIASIFLNILVVKAPPKIQWLAFIFLGGASVLILTMLTATWSAIPVAVVRTLGLGENPVGVVVTAEGCDTFNKGARGQKICQMDADQKLGWVCPVILKSRIGAPMIFELTSFGDNGSWPISPFEIETKRLGGSVSHLRYQRIQLAKSEVKSWPSITPFPQQKESKLAPGGDAASPQGDYSKKLRSRHLVSYLNQSFQEGNEDQRQWLVTQCGSVVKEETAPPDNADVSQTQSKLKPRKGT